MSRSNCSRTAVESSLYGHRYGSVNSAMVGRCGAISEWHDDDDDDDGDDICAAAAATAILV